MKVTLIPENHTGEDGFEEFVAEQFPVGARVAVEAEGMFFYATVESHEARPDAKS